MQRMLHLMFVGTTALSITSCSGGNDKIAGYWSNLPNARLQKGNLIWNVKIDKVDDDRFTFVQFQFEPNDTVKLTYNKEYKTISGFIGGTTCNVKYLKDKDHLLLTDPRNVGDLFPMEFERMNADTVAAYLKSKAQWNAISYLSARH